MKVETGKRIKRGGFEPKQVVYPKKELNPKLDKEAKGNSLLAEVAVDSAEDKGLEADRMRT